MSYQILITSRSFRQSPGKHWDVLKAAGCELIDTGLDRALTEAELIQWIPAADGALLGVDPVTAQVVSVADRLKVISRQGVGIDSVDLPACTGRRIVVTNTPGASTGSVAELAIALMLALLRRVPQTDRLVKAGQWKRILGADLSGKTLGLIGFGRIARDVARKLRAFDLQVFYFDVIRAAPEEEQDLNAAWVPLEDLFSRVDILSLHALVTPETSGLINRERLARMKPSAILVNTARGELVDETALAAALRAGALAGAAADVFANEPPTGSPLLELDNFIATAHCGAYTEETNERVSLAAAENLVAVLRGERPTSVVNPEIYQLARRE